MTPNHWNYPEQAREAMERSEKIKGTEMTDVELEKMAKAKAEHIFNYNYGNVPETMAVVILSALRAVRDASAPKPLPVSESESVAISTCCLATTECKDNLKWNDGELVCVGTYRVCNKCKMACEVEWVPVSGEIPTPRVDEEFRQKPLNDFNGQPVVLAEFARQLERELATALDANRRSDTFREELRRKFHQLSDAKNEWQARAESAEAKLQAQSMADELAIALTVLLDLPASGDNAVIAARNGARSKAREVLARFEAANKPYEK